MGYHGFRKESRQNKSPAGVSACGAYRAVINDSKGRGFYEDNKSNDKYVGSALSVYIARYRPPKGRHPATCQKSHD